MALRRSKNYKNDDMLQSEQLAYAKTVQTLKSHPNWNTYTFLQIIVRRLPEDVKTFDLHQNFRRFGKINKITILENREGHKSRSAEIVFKPPPSQAFWATNGRLKFKSEDEIIHYVYLELSNRQPKHFTIPSPVQGHGVYEEETILYGKSVDFGILETEKQMKIMACRIGLTKTEISMTLNLKNLEIENHFSYELQSFNGTRTREYRFCIALDDKFTAWKIPDKLGGMSYIFNLKSPPRYFRKLEDAAALSHMPEARRWSEGDMWSRQTDIVTHKDHFAVINRTAVGLFKNLNSVNIARWTTFRINFPAEAGKLHAQQQFLNALKDFNITIKEAEDFVITYPSDDFEFSIRQTINSQRCIENRAENLPMWKELKSIFISFPVRYQLEVCVSNGLLSEYAIDRSFLEKLSVLPEINAVNLLIQVNLSNRRVFDAMSIFENLQFTIPMKKPKIPEYCIELRHVTVTATGILFHTPSVEVNNRIIRKYSQYSDRFLRVKFEDDDYRGQTRLYSNNTARMLLVFERVKRVLDNGITIGDRHYGFLAWGNSQLREHGAYFFAGVSGGPNAQKIRAEMGAFDGEKVVAKRAARMGQCFSTTKPVTIHLPSTMSDHTIPDIIRGKFNFTDGVGKISQDAAKIVHEELKIKGPIPSAFQFRLGGCKGVLAVSPNLPGVDIEVRNSQFKFQCTSKELEIIRYSEFWQPFTNRQLILVLSNLGISDKIFLEKLHENVQALHQAMNNDAIAIKVLRESVDPNQMTISLSDLVEAGFRRVKEPFVMSLLHLWRAYSLKNLKEKAKMPISKGAFVLGCVDETGTLKGHFYDSLPSANLSKEEKTRNLPEVFLQITNPQTKTREVIEKICFIARNPSLHQGDIRVVKAINVPALHHLCDVLVMPQTGDRDLPSMCAGGDLDGDDYVVCWDEELIPPVWDASPFHYNAPDPRKALREITTADIIKFFVDYIQNDSLGRIAHAHLGAADFLDDSIESSQCQELVHLHSLAVDYPKTGIPAKLPRKLERYSWPHFMEKRGTRYHSRKILGQLYDAVKSIKFDPDWEKPFDSRILNYPKPSHELIEKVKALKHDYDISLQRIMAQHQIKTEFEVWTTFVIDHSKAAKDYKFHEEIGQLSKTLKDQYYEAICESVGGSNFENLAPFAIAAYHYTQQEFAIALKEVDVGLRDIISEPMPFMSFPWLLQDVLIQIVTSVDKLKNSKKFRSGQLCKNVGDGRSEDDIYSRNQNADSSPSSVEGCSIDLGSLEQHLPDPYKPFEKAKSQDLKIKVPTPGQTLPTPPLT